MPYDFLLSNKSHLIGALNSLDIKKRHNKLPKSNFKISNNKHLKKIKEKLTIEKHTIDG